MAFGGHPVSPSLVALRSPLTPSLSTEKCYRDALRGIKFLMGSEIGSDRNSSENWM
jgi:hypothetical protein